MIQAIKFYLDGRREKRAPGTGETQGSDSKRWLYHQTRTREALRASDLVINTYNTGTGKTRAALSRLLDLQGGAVNVLLIAPTNELIHQHARDVAKFIQEFGLRFHVIEANARDVRALAPSIRGGEVLQRLIANYAEFEAEARERKPLVMVTNPDIFYYAMYFQYGPHDQRNVFSEFVKRFDYIIIDEFHYYSNKQVANFLFTLTLFDQFGYFLIRNRRVCLLSATPRYNVLRYLSGIFGTRLTVISPENEPPESSGYETVPVLAPLEVTLQALPTTSIWLDAALTAQIKEWLEQGHDGAIISNSLARINLAYHHLKQQGIKESQIGRITGPEDSQARLNASPKALILATPTVDIGYNFERQSKPDRQNLDFVLTEARFRDELVQRIGRAGRVLGKTHSDIPSRVVALLPENVVYACSELSGRTLNRQEFQEFLNTLEGLPPKHQLENYIRYYALEEATYPLFQFGKMLSPNDEQELVALFDRLHDLFSPNSSKNYRRYLAGYRKYERRLRWLAAVDKDGKHPPERTEEHLRDFMEWTSDGERPVPEVEKIKPLVSQLWHGKRQELIAFVRNQVALTKALFNFRDSFQGVEAVIYDKHHLFSSNTISVHDWLHIAANYQIQVLPDRKSFSQVVNRDAKADKVDIPEGDCYCILGIQLESPYMIGFAYTTSDSKAEFEKCWTCRPVAIAGFELFLQRPGEALPLAEAPPYFHAALKEQIIVCLIIPTAYEWLARSRLNTSGYWHRTLQVSFSNDPASPVTYLLYVGTAAFEAHAALEPILRNENLKRNYDPFIC